MSPQEDDLEAIMAENAKLDEQLTETFRYFCDKFRPIGEPQKLKGPKQKRPKKQMRTLTAQTNTLRKIRNICGDSWLKEPSCRQKASAAVQHLQPSNVKRQLLAGLSNHKVFASGSDSISLEETSSDNVGL
jgi:hypothetical protein